MSISADFETHEEESDGTRSELSIDNCKTFVGESLLPARSLTGRSQNQILQLLELQ